MNPKERFFIGNVFVLIGVLIGVDLWTDSREVVSWWHLLLEVLLLVCAVSGFAWMIRENHRNKVLLEKNSQQLEQVRLEAERWREQAKNFLVGLSEQIDQQLMRWQLTAAEKEIAFLLLKGFSSKEIAEMRGTSEKTVRVQISAVYQKSGLHHRTEFIAFFLEDLLAPAELVNISKR